MRETDRLIALWSGFAMWSLEVHSFLIKVGWPTTSSSSWALDGFFSFGVRSNDFVVPQNLLTIEVYPRAPMSAQTGPYARDRGSAVIWTETLQERRP